MIFKQKSNENRLIQLFFSMLNISAFTFGGGFVIVSLMKKKLVDELGWITEEEMLDYTALAQSCPGAVAVNAAILVGWRVGGAAGMAVAVLGTVLPPMVILSIISLFYSVFATNGYVAAVLMGMQAGVAAVIADVVCSLCGSILRKQNGWHISIMIAAFLASCIAKINVIVIILAAAILGMILTWAERRDIL